MAVPVSDHHRPRVANIARCEIVVRLPPAATWDRLSDLSLAHHYVPGIRRTEITTAERRGVGASRKVYRSATDAMDETVVEWEEGVGFRLRLHYGDGGPPAPFEQAWFRYRIEDGDTTATRLSLALEYEMRWGTAGRILGALGTHWIIRRQVQTIANRLKQFYEK